MHCRAAGLLFRAECQPDYVTVKVLLMCMQVMACQALLLKTLHMHGHLHSLCFECCDSLWLQNVQATIHNVIRL